ncbi:MAG TPA: hypothetical protein VFK13_09345 [Gemmatimonadaceae bacterium]|nr:hypothetical protein [Gemmatimonadaceae bacterium]
MRNRKTAGLLLAVWWVVMLALLGGLIYYFHYTASGARFAHEQGFPHMPLYGAITWWFFFAIPMIGYTWGFFNDLKEEPAA